MHRVPASHRAPYLGEIGKRNLPMGISKLAPPPLPAPKKRNNAMFALASLQTNQGRVPSTKHPPELSFSLWSAARLGHPEAPKSLGCETQNLPSHQLTWNLTGGPGRPFSFERDPLSGSVLIGGRVAERPRTTFGQIALLIKIVSSKMNGCQHMESVGILRTHDCPLAQQSQPLY